MTIFLGIDDTDTLESRGTGRLARSIAEKFAQAYPVPTAWSWDFGDGNTSILRNPANTFAAAGTYPVSLTVENPYGKSTTVRRVYVR